jgi:hypothetical protein
VTDTMKSVLAWSADTAAPRIIAEEVRFTRDGSLGSVFGASSALTPGEGGRHLFGAGTANCLTEVEFGPAGPEARQRCPAVRLLYRSDPPPELAARLRMAPAALRIEWPPALPAYLERIAVDGTTVLLRPFTADSLVLQTAAPESRDLAVAPLDGLIGCRALGCLWVFEGETASRAWFLDLARLRALLAGGA